jgi:hypothetical protein
VIIKIVPYEASSLLARFIFSPEDGGGKPAELHDFKPQMVVLFSLISLRCTNVIIISLESFF